MVLLRVLHTLAERHGWKLAVAHFNHQLRGRSSDADESFVRRTAEKVGLKFVSRRGDVVELKRREKISLEMAARQLRHKFLAQTARNLGLDTIALAHHADDQLELFFLRLLRGAGGAGLAGMKWSNSSPADAGIWLVRPLLGETKAALAEFANAEKLRFREDESNASRDILRNRIRHELLPLLRENYQPALARTTARAGEILGANADFAEAAAKDWRAGKRAGGFEKLHVAVQRSCLQAELIDLGIEPEFELIERLRACAGTMVEIGTNRLIARDRAGRVRFHAVPKTPAKLLATNLEIAKARGQVEFGNLVITWSLGRPERSRGLMGGARRGHEVFDAGKVGTPVTLRHWRAGDRFQPIGMAVSVKLQDLFMNQKIPREERHRRVLAVASNGEIFWVEGLRIAEKFKVISHTEKLLAWWWRGKKIVSELKPRKEKAE